MTPKELDDQNTIKIDEWVDIDSERWREVDDNPSFTKRIIRIGFEGGRILRGIDEPPFLIADSLGRLWIKNRRTGSYSPFHLEYGRKLLGFRISAKAVN